jgi:hypothetical protein
MNVGGGFSLMCVCVVVWLVDMYKKGEKKGARASCC